MKGQYERFLITENNMNLNIDKLKGKFLSIEGGDGSGKGTLIEMLIKYLSKEDINFITTREPGGTPVAEQIRALTHEDIDAVTETLLFAAARRDHVEKVIKPALNNNILVISDRFTDSSLIYQGIGRGLGIEQVLNINKFAINDLEPFKTIYLDIDPEIGLKRIHTNNREINRLDLQDIEFYKKNREGYLALAQKYPNRYIVINANQSIDDVFKEVISKLNKSLL